MSSLTNNEIYIYIKKPIKINPDFFKHVGSFLLSLMWLVFNLHVRKTQNVILIFSIQKTFLFKLADVVFVLK